MTKHSTIPLSGKVLVWARETAGLTPEQAAERMKRTSEEIISWESEESVPTLPQLETLAYKIYKRPLSLFFLEEPPQVPSLAQDFRTINSQELSALSYKNRLAIRQTKAKKYYLEELFGSDNYQQSGLARLRVTIQQNPIKAGQRIRKAINYSLQEQQAAGSAYEVFNSFRERLEDQRIFTFQVSLDDIRGFALYDSAFPLIGINSGDYIGAKVFSLLHELVHLLLRDGDVLVSTHPSNGHSQLEKFCNAVAAEIFLPSSVLSKFIDDNAGLSNNLEMVRAIARNFKVSHTVAARQLLDRDRINTAEYRGFAAMFAKKHTDAKARQKQNPGAPPYHVIKKSQLGGTFINRTFELLQQGALDVNRASEILGVKRNHFDKLMQNT